MKLKLKITNMTFEGEVDLLPTIAADAGELIEAVAAPVVAAIAAPAEPLSAPLPEEAKLETPKPKRTYKTRKPRTQRVEPAEETGPIKVNTGRRSTREALDIVRSQDQITPKELGERLGITAAAACARLSYLMAKGEVSLVSRGVYKIAEPVDQ